MLKNLDKFEGFGGTLFAINKDIDLSAKRMFFVSNVPKGEVRGNHAHVEDKQLLICIQGKILVSLDDGKEIKQCVLKKGQSVLMDSMIWGKQTYLTGEDILLVLCDNEYEKSDYITNYKDFLAMVNK
tara:strand:- start:140 stop:520 length:381 start_codon:yes stop_codon:yes gene_type:complete